MNMLWKITKRVVAIIIILVFVWCIYGAFNGIQPFSDYKNNIEKYINSLLNNQEKVINVVTRSYTLFDNQVTIYIEPTINTLPQTYYKVYLYKNGVEICYRLAIWDGNELDKLTIKSAIFEIPDSDYEAYVYPYLFGRTTDPFGTIFTVKSEQEDSKIYVEMYYNSYYSFLFFH